MYNADANAMFANIYENVLDSCPILTRASLAKQFPVKIPRIRLSNIRPVFLEYRRTDGRREARKENGFSSSSRGM
jgi:hypothetical protein